MSNVVLIVNVAGQAPGAPGQSRLFEYSVLSPTPPLVTLSLNDDTGVDDYFWEFLDKPKDSVAVFDDPTSAAPTFTPDAGLTSTYFFQCSVNSGESRGQIALAFSTEILDLRKLAAGEGPQFDALKGWVEAYNDFVDKVDSFIGGGSMTGPDPSTIRAISTYADITGSALLDNLIRIDSAIGGSNLDYRAIQARDDEGTPVWHDLIRLEDVPGNGIANGLYVILGNFVSPTMIEASNDPLVQGPGGTGKLIYESINSSWQIAQEGGVLLSDSSTQRVFYLGTSDGQVNFYAGSADPNSVVLAVPGSIYYRVNGVNSAVYQHKGAIESNNEWVVIAGGGTIPNVGVYAYSAGTISLASDTDDIIAFQSNRDDTGSDYTMGPGDSYWTCPTAGRYVFCASARLTMSDASGGAAELSIVSSVHSILAASRSDFEAHARDLVLSVTCTVYCDVNEEIRLHAYQDSSLSADIEASGTHFSATQITQV